jgi:hypothetical protein
MTRGLEKNLVILDRTDYNVNKRYIKQPEIVNIVRFGSGWIDVTMNDGFIYRRSGGTIGWRYCNPGNIKYGEFARTHRSIGKGWGGHAVFPTYEIGKWAKKQLLFTPIRKYYNLKLIDAMSYYAPVNDPRASNQPRVYARFIVNRVDGISLNTRLRDMNEHQQEQMLRAMEIFEGYRVGRIERIG